MAPMTLFAIRRTAFLLGPQLELVGKSDWRARQDLNLQPSDPKSEALSS